MDAVPNIRAVVFDAFGTLVEIGEQRRPFGRLMKWIRENHAAPADDEAAWLMRYSFDLHGAAKAAGIIPPAELMERLSDDLAAELSSVTAFEDALSALEKLRGLGFKLGICSNLVAPYASATKRALPFDWQGELWSFEVGAIKPEPVMYEAVSRALPAARPRGVRSASQSSGQPAAL